MLGELAGGAMRYVFDGAEFERADGLPATINCVGEGGLWPEASQPLQIGAGTRFDVYTFNDAMISPPNLGQLLPGHPRPRLIVDRTVGACRAAFVSLVCPAAPLAFAPSLLSRSRKKKRRRAG